MKTILQNVKIIFFLFFCVSSVFAQHQPEINHEKYWKFKEQMKNFVVVSDQSASNTGTGYSMPMTGIGGRISDKYSWSDNGIRLGNYIGMLATEYYLLKRDNQWDEGMRYEVIQELWCALEAFNRLDIAADGQLNGFFWRDDVTGHFLTDSYNGVDDAFVGKTNMDYLTGNLAPLPDFWDVEPPNSVSNPALISSGYYPKITQAPCYTPSEESQDQAIGMLMGLALVKACVPYYVYYHPPPASAGITKHFADGETDIRYEAILIANRITEWIQLTGRDVNGDGNLWEIEDPTHAGCEYGDACDNSCGISPNTNGANVVALSFGFAEANCWIRNNSGCNYDWLATIDQYIWDFVYASPYYHDYTFRGCWCWPTYFCGYNYCHYDIHISVSSDELVLKLAAIGGNYWQYFNQSIGSQGFKNRLIVRDVQYLDLVYQVLHRYSVDGADGNDIKLLTDNYYQCLLNAAGYNLNAAPNNVDNGDGITQYSGIFEWDKGDRLMNGPGTNCGSDQTDPVGYMLYFNLYCITHPSYLNYYYRIEPTELAPEILVKEAFVEQRNRNFIASNSIIACGTCEQQGNLINPCPGNSGNSQYGFLNSDTKYIVQSTGTAAVTFKAGKEVILEDGFETGPGANFEASIDPTIYSPYYSPLSSTANNCTNDYRLANPNSSAPHGGNNQLINNVMVVLPNPNNGMFDVSVPTNKENNFYSLFIFDVLGNNIIEKEKLQTNSRQSIDLSGYPKGVYYAKAIENTGEVYVKQIIIQ